MSSKNGRGTVNTTKIEWTDKTWSPITGCTPVSDGCKNCYARRMAARLRGRYGYPADDPFRVTFPKKNGVLDLTQVESIIIHKYQHF